MHDAHHASGGIVQFSFRFVVIVFARDGLLLILRKIILYTRTRVVE